MSDDQFVSATEAVKQIKAGDRVFIHGSAATPVHLVQAMQARHGEGKPIIALPSTTSRGESRIVSFLKQGAGVVTTRGHVHWVVTEHGIVNLFGKNLKQRGKALISIAHPDHRENLERTFHERFSKVG